MVVKRKTKAPVVPVRQINYEEDDDVLFEARSIVALRSDDENEQFFVAELLDDITESMLANVATTINLIYYEKQQDTFYQVGNYDEAPVRAIMCEIDLVRSGKDTFELPAHYIQRIEQVLKSVESGESIPDEAMQPVKKRKQTKQLPVKDKTISPKNKSSRKSAGGNKRQVPAKLNKRTGLQKCIAHIDKEVEDYEMSGSHGFREMVHDILSSSKEIIRAVLTKNYDLLESLTNPDSPHIQEIYALHTVRSVGVPKCALEYALENNDLKAIGILMATKDQKYKFGAKPSCALAALGTGSHTSSYSDYGRRAINASRGGKEGVNALLKDQENDKVDPFGSQYKAIRHVIWTKSYDIVALFYPGDSWVSYAESILPQVFRCGNVELAEKMVAILEARSGWGYNNLHLQVLREGQLEPFRRASALKKANGNGISPLHLAALSIYPNNLQQIIRELNGTDLSDFCDKNKWHAVHYAAVSPSSSSMRLLLENGVDLRAKTEKKETALYLACKMGRVETVRAILEHISEQGEVTTYVEFCGPNGYRPIHIAARNGFASIIELLLKFSANVKTTTATSDNKKSALALAAEWGHLDCVVTLLRHGAKADINDKVRRTPLMYAVMNGHTSIARALINADADVNAADSSLNTVMHYAASYGWLSCVQLLHSIKAETWSSNDWGYTPMACAALKGRYDVSHYLIEHSDQKKIDFQDANGATMLYLQCKHAKTIDEINFLLSKGASPNCPTLEKLYPLQIVLMRLGKVKNPNQSSRIRDFLLEVVRQLINCGACTNHEDFETRTPLILAIESGCKEAFDILAPRCFITKDVWIAAIRSEGEFLAHLLSPTKGPHGPISDGGDLLHAVGMSCIKVPPPLQLLQALISKLENAHEAFHYYDNYGDVPLFTLMHHERNSTDESTDYKAIDLAFMDTLGLFLQHTKNIEKLVCIGQLIDGKRTAKTQNLLHIAASRGLDASSEAKEAWNRWYGDDILCRLVNHTKWPLEQLNAIFNGDTPLLLAAFHNHLNGAAALIDQGADVNYAKVVNNIVKLTPLHAAIMKKNMAMVRLLLENGANPSIGINATHDTPLHVAIESNNGALVELLLSFGADVCAQDAHGRTPLLAAIVKGLSVEKKELHANEIEYGTTINPSMQDGWDFVCEDYTSKTTGAPTNLSAIQALLKYENIGKTIAIPDIYGRTCLHLVSKNRDVHLLRILLNLSTEGINHADAEERTPLHFALNSALMTPEATFDVESILLHAGANVNAVDRFGFTVLHFAFMKVNLDWMQQNKLTPTEEREQKHLKHLESIPSADTDPIEIVGNLCLAANLSVTGADVLGRTCVHLGAATGAIVSVLSILHLAKSKLLEAQDARGDTALGYAMQFKRKAMVTTLIQQGADIHSKFTMNNQKLSYYHFAVEQKWQGICHLLLQSGYCRRQAVEDSIRTHSWQLTTTLITGLLNSSEKTLLQVNDDGETLLHILAAQNVEFDKRVRTIAWQLVDAGVPVSAVTKKKHNALHLAAPFGNLPLYRFILHHHPAAHEQLSIVGNSPFLDGIQNTTKLSIATQLIIYFLRLKADVHARNSRGQSVLSVLIDRFADSPRIDAKKFLLTCQRLLEASASPNGLFTTSTERKCSRYGGANLRLTLLMRVLYIPSSYLRQGLLALLLAYQGDIMEVDDDGNSVLHHAVALNLQDEVAILMSNQVTARVFGIDLSVRSEKHRDFTVAQSKALAMIQNKFGETAMHIAVCPRHEGSFENAEIAKTLLIADGALSVKDMNNQTPVDLAKTQPSGIMYTALTKKALPNIPQIESFNPMPDVDKDAQLFLDECEANEHVTYVPVKPKVNYHCEAGNAATIYVDPTTEKAYSIIMTKVDVQSGQHGINVFYRMQIAFNPVQKVYILFTNWGRIGESGKYQNTAFPEAAAAVEEFHKIFKSKSGNVFLSDSFEKKPGKYMLFQTQKETKEYDDFVCGALKPTSDAPSSLPVAVQEVLQVVTDFRCLLQAVSSDCGSVTSLPLAELQPQVIQDSINQLVTIRGMIEANDDVFKTMNAPAQGFLDSATITALADRWRAATEAIAEKCSRYFECIPRSENNTSAIAALLDVKSVNAEITKLRRLLEIAQTSKIVLAAKRQTINPLDYCYNALQISLQMSSSREFDVISKYFSNGQSDNRFKVARVFNLARRAELHRPTSVPGQPTLLWHGTKKTNLMGILHNGLRIAPSEATISGHAFGRGIYFADSSSKSMKYSGNSYVFHPNTPQARQVHYLLLCEVYLGTQHNVIESEYREAPAEGTHSTFAIGKTQPDPKDLIAVPALGKSKVPLGKLVELGNVIPYKFSWYAGPATKETTTDNEGSSSFYVSRHLNANAQQTLYDFVQSDLMSMEITEKEAVNEFLIWRSHYFYTSPTKIVIDIKDKEYSVSGQLAFVDAKVTVDYNDSTKNFSFYLHGKAQTFKSSRGPKDYNLQENHVHYINANEYIVFDESQVQIKYLVEVERTQ